MAVGDRLGARRPALTYVVLACATVALGLATRRYPHLFPSFIAKYAGDALWAALVYWLLALFWPRSRSLTLAATALGIAFAVELSQLYHAPGLDDVRASRLGALVLGRGFLWSDLVCYIVGVMGAAALDRWLVARQLR